MSTRIDDTFDRLRAAGRKGFIAYICAGDPSLDATRNLALELEQAGVDLLELGVPFSDPLADGIVNQLAAQRALAAGTTMQSVLDCVRTIRRTSQLPIVLYTYLNPLLRFGVPRFFHEADAAGVDGVLLLDLPPDEDRGDLACPSRVQRIRLVAPTTPPERIATIAARAEGFIYYVSREGVTGEQAAISHSIAERVALIRQFTALPVAVGFGVSTPDHAAEVARCADAVVVGSAIVKRIAEHAHQPDLARRVADFVRPMTSAVKAV